MRLWHWFAIASALPVVLGCSSSESENKAEVEPGCSTAPQCGSCEDCYDTCVCNGGGVDACITQCSSSGGSGGGGAGGSGGSAGGSGGSAGSSGAPAYETVTIETAVRPVAPGEEAFFCQNFANPFGKNVEVIESESFMTPGSHHMFVFYEPGASDGPVVPCSGLEFKPAVHGAQTPQSKIVYPPGVGRVVDSGNGLRVSAHYLNTGSTTIDAKLTVVFKVVPEGTIEHQAGAMFFNNLAIWVQPNSTATISDTCTLSKDIQLINVVSHMHQYSTHFIATTSGGQKLYETTDWDEPQSNVFDPPLLLEAGTQITYSCEYNNTTSTPLTFGESAKFNEMCILSGTYFPAPNGAAIGCN
jgi:hypothetical protein